jgi:hypothetical protein
MKWPERLSFLFIIVALMIALFAASLEIAHLNIVLAEKRIELERYTKPVKAIQPSWIHGKGHQKEK